MTITAHDRLEIAREDCAPTSSPWGSVDWRERLAPGVWRVATPGHGGIALHPVLFNSIPAAFRCNVYGGASGGRHWYEEDCEALFALFALREELRAHGQGELASWIEECAARIAWSDYGQRTGGDYAAAYSLIREHTAQPAPVEA